MGGERRGTIRERDAGNRKKGVQLSLRGQRPRWDPKGGAASWRKGVGIRRSSDRGRTAEERGEGRVQ